MGESNGQWTMDNGQFRRSTDLILKQGDYPMPNKPDVLREKSYAFALRIVRMFKHLSQEKREFVLSKQTLRSGTSIGANIAEASQGQSKLDFVHKLSISLKEAVETEYWLQLLQDSDYLTTKQAGSLIDDCEELQRLLTSSIKTTKAGIASKRPISQHES
jgi:four helix bundle protein